MVLPSSFGWPFSQSSPTQDIIGSWVVVDGLNLAVPAPPALDRHPGLCHVIVLGAEI